MKTTLFIASLFIHSLIVIGQSYQSIFSSDTTIWNVYECELDAGGTIVYYSYSDTSINKKIYHKLYRERLFSLDQKLQYDKDLCGFIHEDTILGKYWFLKINDNAQKEALFMDLSLNMNDTMVVITDFRFMNSDSVIVDSVYFENNRKIVRINKTHYDCHNEYKIKFIEGVGPTNGFYMGEMLELPQPYTLMCKFDNDLKTYSFDKNWFSNCYHDSGAGIMNSHFGNSIQIYPNPSQGKIFIKAEIPYSNLSYTTLNSLGQIVSNGKFLKESNELNFKENGLYFIKIANDKYQTIKKVIIYGY